MTVNEIRTALADASIPDTAYVMIEMPDGTRLNIETLSFDSRMDMKRAGDKVMWGQTQAVVILIPEM